MALEDVPQFAPTTATQTARRRLVEGEQSNVLVQLLLGDAIGFMALKVQHTCRSQFKGAGVINQESTLLVA